MLAASDGADQRQHQRNDSDSSRNDRDHTTMFPPRLCLRERQHTQHNRNNRENYTYPNWRICCHSEQTDQEIHGANNECRNRDCRRLPRVLVDQQRRELVLRRTMRRRFRLTFVGSRICSGRGRRCGRRRRDRHRLRRLFLRIEHGRRRGRHRLRRTLYHQLVAEILVEFRDLLLRVLPRLVRHRHLHDAGGGIGALRHLRNEQPVDVRSAERDGLRLVVLMNQIECGAELQHLLQCAVYVLRRSHIALLARLRIRSWVHFWRGHG